jgi:hypothetical protein
MKLTRKPHPIQMLSSVAKSIGVVSDAPFLIAQDIFTSLTALSLPERTTATAAE